MTIEEVLDGQIRRLDEWAGECADTDEIVKCADAIVNLAKLRAQIEKEGLSWELKSSNES